MAFRRWTSHRYSNPRYITALLSTPTLSKPNPPSLHSHISAIPLLGAASVTGLYRPAPLSKAADPASQRHSCESPLPSNDPPSPPSFVNPVRALTPAEVCAKPRKEEYHISHAPSTLLPHLHNNPIRLHSPRHRRPAPRLNPSSPPTGR